jgi:hypothetical protein
VEEGVVEERIVEKRIVVPPAVGHPPVVEVIVIFMLRGRVRFRLAVGLSAVITPILVRILLSF